MYTSPPRPMRRRGFTMVEIMIIVAIVGILITIAIPTWLRARQMSAQRSCQENLTKIDGAKEQWALEFRQGALATPGPGDLYGPDRYVKSEPQCPTGGTYTINNMSVRPECSRGLDPEFPHAFPPE